MTWSGGSVWGNGGSDVPFPEGSGEGSESPLLALLADLVADGRDPDVVLDFDALDDGVLVVRAHRHREWRVDVANRATSELLGVPEHRLLGRPLEEVLAPAPAVRATEHLHRALGSQQMVRFEIEVDDRAGGRGRVLEVVARALDPASEVLPRVVVAVRNVTERSVALHRAVGRFEAAFESTPVGVALLDPTGRFERVNGALAAQLGECEADLRRRWLPDVVDPVARHGVLDALAALVEGSRSAWQGEVTLLPAGGGERVVVLSVAAVEGVDGRLESVVLHAVDVSDRRRAEEALRSFLAVEGPVLDVATGMVGLDPEEAWDRLDEALGHLGRAAGADRCYLVLRPSREALWSERPLDDGVVREWCAPGVAPYGARLNAEIGEVIPGAVTERLAAGEAVQFGDIARMPAEAAAEQQVLARNQVVSFLSLPLLVQGRLVAAIGLSRHSRREPWPPEHVEVLRRAGDVLVRALGLDRGALGPVRGGSSGAPGVATRRPLVDAPEQGGPARDVTAPPGRAIHSGDAGRAEQLG